MLWKLGTAENQFLTFYNILASEKFNVLTCLITLYVRSPRGDRRFDRLPLVRAILEIYYSVLRTCIGYGVSVYGLHYSNPYI